ncbi:MAG TPA: carboxypeptidase-like regulatory domain-containing protein [Candidatus Thermoplasmatota archaeon]|nr:carboxypeptidase-like regulatory domain-containing protein [Candidatus Thermoplasmatota archaeon]
MKRRSALAIVVLLALLFSGCASGSTATPKGPEPISDIEGAASLGGYVLDDSSVGIPDVIVGLIELSAQATTATDGSYLFKGVPPGTYKLAANKLGFESVLVSITLAADEQATRTLTLQQLAVNEAYQDQIGPYPGYFECAVGTPSVIRTCAALAPSVFTNDKNQLDFQLSAPHWESMVGELRWRPAAVGTSQALASYASYQGRAGTHWWCASDGPSPNSFRYENPETELGEREDLCSDKGDQEPAPKMGLKMFMKTDTGFGGTSTSNPPVRATVQQRFEIFMTVFYGAAAPENYSGFPDG